MSDDELVFHTNPMSRGRIVRWMLEELGVGYRTVVQEYGGSMKSPEYLAINPMGKVPALEHRGVVVTEAAASASPWLLGDRFSAADVYVGSEVDFGLGFKSIPERPAFTAWVERLRGREAYRRARELDDGLMPKG